MNRGAAVVVFALLVACTMCAAGAAAAGPLLGDSARDAFASAMQAPLPSGPAAGRGAVVGEPAPDFTLETADGKRIRLSELRGKAVLLNFWASWCGPCKAEMPDLQAIAQKYEPEGLVVLAVNVGESKGTAVDFLRENKLTLTAPLDESSKVSNDYRVRGLPTTYFIQRDGVIREMFGGALNTSAFERRVKGIL
jgi:thiol-disulfide isomerase/thioredoxin